MLLEPWNPYAIPELVELNFAGVNSLNPPYPRVTVFQKLLSSLAQSSQNRTL